MGRSLTSADISTWRIRGGAETVFISGCDITPDPLEDQINASLLSTVTLIISGGTDRLISSQEIMIPIVYYEWDCVWRMGCSSKGFDFYIFQKIIYIFLAYIYIRTERYWPVVLWDICTALPNVNLASRISGRVSGFRSQHQIAWLPKTFLTENPKWTK